MHDIYIGIAVIGLISLAAFIVSTAVVKRMSRRAAIGICILIVTYLLAHRWIAADRLWIARVLPFSNVMIVGNPLPVAVAALAGFAWRLMPGHAMRRALLIAPLIGLCAYRSFAPAFSVPPILMDERWRDGVCLQTSLASCSAASAATLLHANGIDATESEMAMLCLTSERGTSTLGLCRGLMLKTANTPWKVETFTTDAAGLHDMDGPMILPVRFERRAGIDPRYERDWGWLPGVSHHIVFFRFTDDGEKCEMGDPSVGREHWSARDIGVLWRGEGIRLVRR